MCGQPASSLRLPGGIGRHDVQQNDRKPGVGEVRGNSGAHGPRPENRDATDEWYGGNYLISPVISIGDNDRINDCAHCNAPARADESSLVNGLRAVKEAVHQCGATLSAYFLAVFFINAHGSRRKMSPNYLLCWKRLD
jgi:hypothetical protein